MQQRRNGQRMWRRQRRLLRQCSAVRQLSGMLAVAKREENMRACFFCVVAALLFVSLNAAGQETQNSSGSLAITNQAQFPVLAEGGIRRVDNGYLVTIAAPPYMVPDKPGIIVYGRDGAVIREAIVWIEGAVNVIVEDAAVSASGTLVVSGGAVNKDGVVATFIAEIGSDDRVAKIVRTTPFTPQYLCALDDGTVWSYGFDRDDHNNL